MTSIDKSEALPIRLMSKKLVFLGFPIPNVCEVKKLWVHIDGSTARPTNATTLAQWETHDARIITWVFCSINPHIVWNLRPCKTAKGMWEYLKRVHNQENSTRRFQLEYEHSEYS